MSGPFLPPKTMVKGMSEDQKQQLRKILKARRAKVDLAMKRIDKALAVLGEPRRSMPPARGSKPRLVKTGTND